MAAIESVTETGIAKSSLWDKKLFRLGLFVGSYIAAVAIASVLWMDASLTAGALIGNVLFGFVLFPSGLGWLIASVVVSVSERLANVADVLAALVWLAAYPIYLGISLIATVSKSRRVFWALYVIFVVWLLVNIKGCTYGAHTF